MQNCISPRVKDWNIEIRKWLWVDEIEVSVCRLNCTWVGLDKESDSDFEFSRICRLQVQADMQVPAAMSMYVLACLSDRNSVPDVAKQFCVEIVWACLSILRPLCISHHPEGAVGRWVWVSHFKLSQCIWSIQLHDFDTRCALADGWRCARLEHSADQRASLAFECSSALATKAIGVLDYLWPLVYCG